MIQKVVIRVVDVESTGMAPPAEIIETGYCDVVVTIEGDVKSFAIFKGHATLWGSSAPIPIEAMAVHHITDQMIAGLPLLVSSVLKSVITCDHGQGAPMFLCAHQAAFEQQWITGDHDGGVRWIDTYKCALRLLPDSPSHSNQALRYYLGLDLSEEDSMPPHRALPDAFVTAHILVEMLKTTSVKDLVAMTLQPRYFATCPMGKHKNKPWAELPHDYLTWMLRAEDIDADIKAAAKEEIARRKA